MQVSELYNQVAQLGFEDSLEYDKGFFYAANRALLQVCKIKPAISSYVLNHRPLKNYVSEPTFTPIERAEDLIFEATDVKSYYLECDGNGILYVEKFVEQDGTWQIIGRETLNSSGNFVAYKNHIKDGENFVNGLVRLRLSGEYYYSVRNVAMYRHLLSAAAEDIPAYEPYTRYDLKLAVGDLMALCCPPIKEEESNTILNQEYRMEGDSTILLPYDKKGVYKVLYERYPKKIENNGDAANDDTPIDLDEELCSLLPILIAGYVWADDEPEKAEYYMALYRERVAEIERKKVINKPVIIKNTTGW